MRFSILLFAVVFALLRNSTASLYIQGPTEAALGQSMTLECLDSESEHNMSFVHFEKLSEHRQKWYQLDVYGYGYYYLQTYCPMGDREISMVRLIRTSNGRLLLELPSAQVWSDGVYRCVSDNATKVDSSSLPFKLTVHYLLGMKVNRAGASIFSYYLSPQNELRIPQWEDVELNCSATASETPQYSWLKEGEEWTVRSSKLKLKQVREQDSGKYTCTAQHPSMSSLIKKRTINLIVLPAYAAWYESTTGHIYLIVSIAVVILLAIIISMMVFLCHWARQNKSKGPLDDHSQKKPICKSSVESLPSTDGDKQPLV